MLNRLLYISMQIQLAVLAVGQNSAFRSPQWISYLTSISQQMHVFVAHHTGCNSASAYVVFLRLIASAVSTATLRLKGLGFVKTFIVMTGQLIFDLSRPHVS